MLKTYGSDTIEYDNSGNPTSYRGDDMQWIANRLAVQNHGGNLIYYAYNESGLRVSKKIIGGTQTRYIWKDGMLAAMQIGDEILEFSYAATGEVISVLYRSSSQAETGTRYFYMRNVQGDIIGLMDSDGTKVVTYRYDSWGKAVIKTDSTTTNIGTLNPYRYRGYIYDEETGLYYLKTRYYDPEVGRFISSDALTSTGQGVIGCNMFCYCLNSPIALCDPNGSWSFNRLAIGNAPATYVEGRFGEVVKPKNFSELYASRCKDFFNPPTTTVIGVTVGANCGFYSASISIGYASGEYREKDSNSAFFVSGAIGGGTHSLGGSITAFIGAYDTPDIGGIAGAGNQCGGSISFGKFVLGKDKCSNGSTVNIGVSFSKSYGMLTPPVEFHSQWTYTRLLRREVS